MTAAELKMKILNLKSERRRNEKQGLHHLTDSFCILKHNA